MRQTNIDFKNYSLKEIKRIGDDISRAGNQYTRAFQKVYQVYLTKTNRKEKIRKLFNI